MKKFFVATILMLSMVGCASVRFYGAEAKGSSIPRLGGLCTMVKGFGLQEVTNKEFNCVCALEMSSTKDQGPIMMLELLTRGATPALMAYLVRDEWCDPKWNPEQAGQ